MTKETEEMKRCEKCEYRRIHDGEYPAWCYMFEDFMPGCKQFEEARIGG